MVFHLDTLMPLAREAPPSLRLPPITGEAFISFLRCARIGIDPHFMTASMPENIRQASAVCVEVFRTANTSHPRSANR
jgi:hypothetical protein